MSFQPAMESEGVAGKPAVSGLSISRTKSPRGAPPKIRGVRVRLAGRFGLKTALRRDQEQTIVLLKPPGKHQL
jgi:hypothetical protein